MELDLSLIVIDPELQPREKMDQNLVTQYAEDMLAGIPFPPVRVFHVEGRHLLTQGFHRVHAAQAADRETIDAEIVESTRAEALWDAAGSNVEFDGNGKSRGLADKRRAVRMALEARPNESDRSIAERVRVSQHMVSTHRHALTEPGDQSISRTDVNGIYRRMPFVPDRLPRELPEQFRGRYTSAPPEIFTEIAPQPKGVPSKPTFNQTNEMVDWARWTWNPVTGCEHTCVYCYARDIANRFYAEKFAPTYRPERLEAPRNTRLPGESATTDPVARTAWKNVFVCSMADLFGRWVPDDWIDGVFGSCRQSPEWNYLFLTKFPQRYVDLDFPETSWVGTSVDEQKRVANAEKAFSKIKVPIRWLSVEPMREPIVFNDLSMFDWVVIGGQSRSSGAPEFFPDADWIVDLIYHARQAGCKVYCKPNTDPSGRWAGIYKQYPDIFNS